MKQFLTNITVRLGTTRRKLAVWGAAILLGLLLVTPAQAILGVGDLVYDAACFKELVSIEFQLIGANGQLASQLAQLIQTFKLLKHSQLALGSRGSWVALAQQLSNSAVRDIHGESAQIGWVVNGGGGNPQAAWANGTLGLNGTGFLVNQQPGASVHLSNAASIEMTDAFGADAIKTVGDMRQSQLQISQAVDSLQAQEQALDDDSNTPVAQANITNAALMQLIKLQQGAAAVHTSTLEQLAISNTWQRNAAAEATNFYGQTITYRSTVPSDYGGGASTTLSTFLMP